MTTGNKIVDRRSSVVLSKPYDPAYGSTMSNVGTFHQRVWNGTDYPLTGIRTYKVYNRRLNTWLTRSKPTRSRDGAPHPYTVTSVRTYCPLWGYKYRGGSSYPWPPYWWPSVISVKTDITSAAGPDPWTSNDDLALLGKLRAEVAGSDFHAGVFAAEAPKALRMIGDAAVSLARTIRCVKRGDVAGAVRTLNLYGERSGRGSFVRGNIYSKSNAWLELQYGWIPLLQDMEGSARYLARYLQKPVARVVVRRNLPCFSGWSCKDLNAGGVSLSGRSYYLDYEKTSGKRGKQIIAYLQAVDELTLSGLVDPLAIAWELVPFSFVADWALPIGSYLEALNTARAMKGTFVTTDYWTVKGTGLKHSPLNDQTKFAFYGGSGAYLQMIRLTRSVSTSLSVPTPTLKPIGKIATFGHAVNGLALLGQAFTR